MESYQVYSALYSCKNKRLPVYGVKVGHSLNSIKRANQIMSCMEIQDIFRIKDLTKKEALSVETSTNNQLDELAQSGGSSEFHLFHSSQWGKAYKILVSNFGETIDWQPHANVFSHLSVSTVLESQSWPRSTELKRNYQLIA